jgi:hypothetical protein
MAKTECILWPGYVKPNGYGQATVERRHVYAHRLAYERHVGPIPPGHHVHHRCGVRACVNPDHLALMLGREHTRHHHPPRTVCPRGHSMADAYVVRNRRGRSCRTCHLARQRAYDARVAQHTGEHHV